MSNTDTVHVFERAGLGKAPFRYVGSEEKRGPVTLPDGSQCGAPGQPMGTCDYCAQGIALCCIIEDAEGKRFIVGSDCVRKTGDAGLRKQVNRHASELRKAREAERIEASRERLEADSGLRAALQRTPHSNAWMAKKGLTTLDEVQWLLERGGHTGKLRAARKIDKVLA